MLGARGLALSLGRVHWWSQNLCSWVQLWKCWWRTKRKVDRHLFWQQPWLVHQLQAQVQSEEAQGLLLQSKMPQMERKKKGMCMAQLPHRYSRKDDFWIISTRWCLKKISGTACPLPGSLPHGSWTCEMQEIPIQGTSFLDEDAQSYSGLYGHYFLAPQSGAHCSHIKVENLDNFHTVFKTLIWSTNVGHLLCFNKTFIPQKEAGWVPKWRPNTTTCKSCSWARPDPNSWTY